MNIALQGILRLSHRTEIAIKKAGLSRTDSKVNEYKQADLGLWSNSWMRRVACIMHNIFFYSEDKLGKKPNKQVKPTPDNFSTVFSLRGKLKMLLKLMSERTREYNLLLSLRNSRVEHFHFVL